MRYTGSNETAFLPRAELRLSSPQELAVEDEANDAVPLFGYLLLFSNLILFVLASVSLLQREWKQGIFVFLGDRIKDRDRNAHATDLVGCILGGCAVWINAAGEWPLLFVKRFLLCQCA